MNIFAPASSFVVGHRPIHAFGMDLNLLDSFATSDDDELLPAICSGSDSEPDVHDAGGLSLMDSFAPDKPESPKRQRNNADVHETVVQPSLLRESMLVAPAPAPHPEPRRKRGRKPGVSQHQSDLARLLRTERKDPAEGPVPGRTRREICLAASEAAAKARAERQLSEKANLAQTTLSEFKDSLSTALVPVADDPQTLFNNEVLQSKVLSWNVSAKELQSLSTRAESAILGNTLRLQSKAVLAQRLKVSVQTITRRLRLLAFLLVIVRRGRAHQFLEGMDALLVRHFGDEHVRRLKFTVPCPCFNVIFHSRTCLIA